jgi:hypothetical protein
MGSCGSNEPKSKSKFQPKIENISPMYPCLSMDQTDRAMCKICNSRLIVYKQYWKDNVNNGVISKCPLCDQAKLLYCSTGTCANL